MISIRFGEGDDFLPSVATLMSGTTLAMGITYLARPILTRLYTPEMFGLLGVFAAVVAVLTTISSGRYDDAVMLPEEDDKARNVVFLSLCFLVMLTIITVPIALLREPVSALVGKPELAPFLLLLPVSLLSMGAIRLAEVWLTREKRFRGIAGARASQSATAVPIQLTIGFRQPSPWGLIAGLVAGQALGAIVMVGLCWKRLVQGAFPKVRQLREVAKRYRDFPLFSGPSALLNSTSSQLPAFLLFFFFEPAVVGHYAQAYALLAVPVGLVGSSVAQVYFVRAARGRVDGTLDALTERVFRRLLELGLFPMLAVLLAGPDLIEFVLGSDWRTAGSYAQWLAVWLLLMFVASPLTRLFDVMERLRANLLFNVILFLSRCAVLIVGGLNGSPLLAVALYGSVSAVMYTVMLIWLLLLANADLGAGIRFTLRAVGTAAVPALLVAASVFYEQTPGLVFATTCLAGLVYAVVLVWRGRLNIRF